jgi:hypothetical protein
MLYAAAAPGCPNEFTSGGVLALFFRLILVVQYKLKGPMLEPKSQPTYFQDLVREIEEAPRRTWLERLGKRLSGMIRLQ